MIYGTAWKKERTASLVELALKQGFRAIDTANQPKHYFEPGVGIALERFGVPRSELFLQTKFTPIDSQDARMPYDPNADLVTQVRQSFASSLEHLHTDYIDSYILHGPYHHPGLGREDFIVWNEMEDMKRSGQVKQIGISNINVRQLEMLVRSASILPAAVQNRCYARRGWDREVRELCRKHNIQYQGFSLLTANPEVMEHPDVIALAKREGVEPAQIVFQFSRKVGMMPLTGTTNAIHMQQDLASDQVHLAADEVSWIEKAFS